MTTACSGSNCTNPFSISDNSGPLKVRRFTITFPSDFTLTTTSPMGAGFSFAEVALGILTSNSFSFRAAFQVRRKKIRRSMSTSTSGASMMPGCCGVACLRRFMRCPKGLKKIQNNDGRLASKFILEQGWGAIHALIVLQRKERQHMGHSRLQVRNQSLRAATKERIENQRRDANGQTAGGVD